MLQFNVIVAVSWKMDQVTHIHKKGDLILYQGHKYHIKTKNKTGTNLWRCSQWRKLKCGGRLTICNDIIQSQREHSIQCKPDHTKNEILEEIDKCRQKIQNNDNRPIPAIYEEMLGNLENRGINLAAEETIPKFESVKTGLYKLRNDNAGVSKTCFNTVPEVEIPNSMTDFMLADYSHDGNRIIIFCLPDIVSVLPKVKHVFCDGTFRSCPPPFEQIYSIHGDVGSTMDTNNVIPLLYVLMTDRTEESYNVLYQLLKTRVPNFEPTKFTLDFEIPAINAIRKQFPSSEVKGCYYHFTHNVWKKGRKLGLTKSKANKRIVALCAALPLVPKSYLTTAWAYVKSKMSGKKEMKEFRRYMTTFWFGNKTVKKIWTTFGERHRTNNCLEGWHTKLNKRLGKKNRNILNFLEIIKNDARYNNRRIKNVITNRRKKQQTNNDEFIMESQMELISQEITIGHFLEQVK